MSILIKDMDMPSCCSDCSLNYDQMSCSVTGTRWWSDTMVMMDFDPNKKRLYDCPLKETQSEPKKGKWIPCSERLPTKNGEYIVTDDSGGKAWVEMSNFIRCDDGSIYWDHANVTAWMPKPKPYQEGDRMIELKPCPFCGEYPVMDHISDSLFDCGIFAYWVVCPKCGIRTHKNRDQAKVIEVWNRRAERREEE